MPVRLIRARNRRGYDINGLVQLRVVAELRQGGVSLQHVRRVVQYLQAHYRAPLSELRFSVRGNEICFQHPDGSWEGDRQPGQLVYSQVLQLEAIRMNLLRQVGENDRTRDAGQIQRRQRVRGAQPVFAGTRIPVAAVMAYLDRGYGTKRIIQAYPQLTPDDIEAARRQAGWILLAVHSRSRCGRGCSRRPDRVWARVSERFRGGSSSGP
ncbi:DUF433 domain-containing protein [Protofrankia coriariae]